MRQENGLNQRKSHEFLNFDDIIGYTREQAYTVHHWILCQCSIYKHDVAVIYMSRSAGVDSGRSFN